MRGSQLPAWVSKLFPSEIMFHQQPVAWVLGETMEAARPRTLALKEGKVETCDLDFYVK